MKNEIYNLEKLVKIKIYDKEKVRGFRYGEFKKSFWGNQKAGFYYTLTIGRPDYYSAEDLNNKKFNNYTCFVEDENVYYYPKVVLRFPEEIRYEKEFKTREEAEVWAEEIANKGIKFRFEY